MTESNTAVETLRKLYLQGRYKEVVDLMAGNWRDLLSTDEAPRLLGQARIEAASQQQQALLSQLNTALSRLSASVHQQLVSSLLEHDKYHDHRRLERFGFSAGSQNDEDGILTEIFRRIGCPHRTFFEFGVGNGLQNCTVYFLLAGWRGGWVEVNPSKFDFINRKFSFYIASSALHVTDQPVTPENVDQIASDLGVATDLDLLSIDIDGNDYYIFEAMNIKPRVIVAEYNGLFPPPFRIVQAYDPDYRYSPDSYTGCSLQSLVDLASRKGYRLVGTNLSGLNAFFVRGDLFSANLFVDAEPLLLYNPARHQLAWGDAFSSGPRLSISPLQGVASLDLS
jgi:hypothetical protein